MRQAFDQATSYSAEEPEPRSGSWMQLAHVGTIKGCACYDWLAQRTLSYQKPSPALSLLPWAVGSMQHPACTCNCRFGKELEKIDIAKYRGNYIQYNVGHPRLGLVRFQTREVRPQVNKSQMISYCNILEFGALLCCFIMFYHVLFVVFPSDQKIELYLYYY